MRNYKRSSNRKLCTKEILDRAKAYVDDGYSIRAAARMLDIHESTLRKRLKSGHGAVKFGRFTQVFTEEMERLLVAHCKDMDDRFYGLSLKRLRIIAYEYAILNNVAHPFNEQNKIAGKDWAYTFVRKYGLSLRTPSPTSLARMMGFNKSQIELFFNNLSDLYKKYEFPASSIYNMDESGISTVPNKIPKVISTKGKKLVGKVSSAERGEVVTIVCAMSAAGNFVAPAFVFPRKRMKHELMDGSPPESVGMCSDSGYINSVLFLEWLKHFQAKVRADKEHPVLLILDNHSSHKSLEAVLYCRDNFIHLLTIPPHSSHRLQPLDRCYFKPLKTLYADECDRWLTNNPGRQITHFQIAKLLGRAYERCSTMDKGVKAFETCGIYPINKNIFNNEDFLPSAVTDKNIVNNKDVNNTDTDSDADDTVPLSIVRKKIINLNPNVSTAIIACHKTPAKLPLENPNIFTNANELMPIATSEHSPENLVASSSSKDASVDELYYYKPSTSKTLVTPQEILPLPRRSEDQKRRRQGQKSEILSSTPYMKKLEANREEKSRKEGLQARKSVRKNLSGDQIEKKFKKPKQCSTYFACPGCCEEFIEPPVEDWIQCKKCNEWWHEKCTAYENEFFFICDCCK